MAIARGLGLDSFEPLLRRPEPPRIVPAAIQALPNPRITLLRSGDLPYTRSIRHGFLTELEDAFGRVVELNEKAGLSEPVSQPGWQDEVISLLDATKSIGSCDYYVPIGTQAAQMLHHALGEDFGKTPFVFLGVTYPKEAGLLHTATGGSEPWPVTGINYGKGVEEIAVILYYRVFQKHRELEFIYQHDIPQDVIAAQKLRESPLCPEHLEVRPLDHIPTIDDMSNPEKVYFSWYTFERLFESRIGRSLLNQRLVVATTRENVAFGHTGVGVSVDDREIGRMGAKIILRHYAGRHGISEEVDLGSQPVGIPEFRYWVHEGVAKQWRKVFKCRLSQNVLNGAAEVFPIQ